MVPTWWIVGVAIFVPLFLWAVIAGVRSGEDEPWTAFFCTLAFLGTGLASGLFWFG